MSIPTQISLKDAQQHVTSCEDLRNILILNGKYMPAPTSKACRNSEYLVAVYQNLIWVPDYRVVKKSKCLFPPNKQHILDAIIKEIAKKQHPERYHIGFEDASLVDKPWLLDTLCTLNENHLYFDKNYRAKKEECVKNDDDELLAAMMIEDPNGYFHNLPDLHSGAKKNMKRKGRNLFMNKEERKEFAAKKLEIKARKT